MKNLYETAFKSAKETTTTIKAKLSGYAQEIKAKMDAASDDGW